MYMANNQLYRSETDKMIAGICGGFAEAYDIDPSLVRLITALIVLISGGTGLLAYLIAWIIIPHESEVE